MSTGFPTAFMAKKVMIETARKTGIANMILRRK
jgi:LDH2 family malate/lactate/ureidoglycolate dehydrogenase